MGLSGQSVLWEAAAFKRTVLSASRARAGEQGLGWVFKAVAALGPLETRTGEQWPLSPSRVTPSITHTGHIMFLPKNPPLPIAGEDGSAGIPTHQRPCFCFSILSLFPGPSDLGSPERREGRLCSQQALLQPPAFCFVVSPGNLLLP